MAHKKQYALTVGEDDLLANEDINPTEFKVAMAMLRGRLDEIKITPSTRKRCLASLVKSGVAQEVTEQDPPPPLTEPPEADDPASKWLHGKGIEPLNEADGPPEFKSFSNERIKEMGRNGRFGVFCDMYGADGNDPETRRAWIKLETEYRRTDGDRMSEMVYLFHQIIKAAQHEANWIRRGIRQRTPASTWLLRAAFDSEAYNVAPGDKPGEGVSKESLQARIDAAQTKLMGMRKDFVAASPQEPLLSAARRLEAVLRQAENLDEMSR